MMTTINANTLRVHGILPRKGKTARDKANGTRERNANNKAERAAWQRECRQNSMRLPAFPQHTCKGKGNSSKAYKDKSGKRAA